MPIGTILVILLVLMVIGVLPTWPHSRGYGYYPSGGLGLVLIIVIVLLLAGRIQPVTVPSHPLDPATVQLLEEVSLGSARGGKRVPARVDIDVVRPLTEADLPTLLAPPPAGAKLGSGHLQIRHSHHLLARCLVEGHPQERCSLITGYSTSYISSLKGDPAFSELLAYYEANRELAFVDVMDRMRVLGLNTLEELQQRMTDKPEEWTKRELMELTELMLIKGRQAQAAAAVPGRVDQLELASQLMSSL